LPSRKAKRLTAVDDCPEIASGKGSVGSARFITREVNSIVRAEIVGPDGKIEVIEGTPIHPIWSVDRNDWVELGKLQPGDQLLGKAGPAIVLSVTILWSSTAVYNKAFGDTPADIIDTWRKTGLGDDVPWSVNRDWLLERWRRGDAFALATDPSTLPPVVDGFKQGLANGYFTAKELDLLKKLGVDLIEIWQK
jgi:hypothetical protein